MKNKKIENSPEKPGLPPENVAPVQGPQKAPERPLSMAWISDELLLLEKRRCIQPEQHTRLKARRLLVRSSMQLSQMCSRAERQVRLPQVRKVQWVIVQVGPVVFNRRVILDRCPFALGENSKLPEIFRPPAFR